ncbi:exopolysaccharide biosynthesis protein [Tropicimonas sediminicola]|uniref:Uncharacterized conserved protein n=1 Tax=Tropicimonas sediminicola TaxID=1031541 RepID=A0A239L8U5_9RHOB|nr:exopolysaccharide biosynthesis protein [Tropicimonas sediminicola]SNT27057.1 Uncharacterized conserved protein [Tropicimonas sediminicola]
MTLLHPARPLVAQNPGQRLSGVLRDLVAGGGERISVGDLVAALRDRSFAPLMILLAIPNLFFFVPGSSVFTGLPLMFLALQFLTGRQDVWLPRRVADLSIDRAAFARIVASSSPYIERVERLARPRWWPSSHLFAERLIGLATLVLSTFLFLPIPFANGLPALSIILLALGLSERDGYWLAAGLLMTLVSIALVAGMVSLGAFAVVEFILR